MYTAEFFTEAFQSKAEFQKIADAELGQGVLTAGEQLKSQIWNKLRGENLIEFLKKFFKILAILGIGGGIVMGIGMGTGMIIPKPS